MTITVADPSDEDDESEDPQLPLGAVLDDARAFASRAAAVFFHNFPSVSESQRSDCIFFKSVSLILPSGFITPGYCLFI